MADGNSDSESLSTDVALSKSSSVKKKRFKAIRKSLRPYRKSSELSSSDVSALQAEIAAEDAKGAKKPRSRHQSASSVGAEEVESGSKIAKVSDEECGVYVGAIGEANLPGEISYMLGEQVAAQSVLADGKLEVFYSFSFCGCLQSVNNCDRFKKCRLRIWINNCRNKLWKTAILRNESFAQWRALSLRGCMRYRREQATCCCAFCALETQID